MGALAAILDYTQQNKTAVSGGDDGRVLMVAGIRKHLYRTASKWFRNGETAS
jgi:hypothetical protein